MNTVIFNISIDMFLNKCQSFTGKASSSSSGSAGSVSGSSKSKERDLALLRGDLMLAQAAAHGAYHAAVAAAAKGKVCCIYLSISTRGALVAVRTAKSATPHCSEEI